MGISSLVGAGISGAASLFGASEKADAASQAEQYQVQAGQNAQNALTGALATSTSQLSPYTDTGSAAVQTLGNQLTGLATPSTSPSARYVNPSTYATSGTANNISAAGTYMDPNAYGVSASGYGTDAGQYATSADPYKTSTSMSESDLESTPGYQFTLNQGEKAVQNSAAARGLGVSGAALKGAATYATGLSDSTYNTRLQQEQTSNAQNFGQELESNQAGFSNALSANNQNYGLTASAAGQNFSQQQSAKNQDFSQLQGAATTNFGQQQSANNSNFSNTLSGAGQNFNQDQIGFQDAQSGKSQDYNMLTGAAGIGANATGQLVNANTATAEGTANALTGVGSAQAAGTNAAGQAYGSAIQGAGNSLATGITGNNAYLASGGGGLSFTNGVNALLNPGGSTPANSTNPLTAKAS